MLIRLSLENFLFIETCQLACYPHMTVFTGETGAGKSLLFEALGLLSGRRAYNPTGPAKDSCVLEAVIDVSALSDVQAWLAQKNLIFPEEKPVQCTLRRVWSKSTSRAFINDCPVSLSFLREVGAQWVMFHAQQGQQALLTRHGTLQCLDHYAVHPEKLAAVKTCYEAYQACLKEKERLYKKLYSPERSMNFLQYQWQALDHLGMAHLTEALINQKEDDYRACMRLQQYLETYQSGLDLLEQAVLPALHKYENTLARIPDETAAFLTPAEQARIELQELQSSLRRYLEKIDTDPAHIKTLETEWDALQAAAQKHRVKPSELPSVYDALSRDIAAYTSGKEKLEALEKKLADYRYAYSQAAQGLSESRKAAAQNLSTAVESMIRDLNMKDAAFAIVLTSQDTDDPQPYGMEKADFFLRANPGMPLQPLAKAVSGGELSRISLALHAVMSDKHALPLLVFDEVDTGIGGETAIKVGQLLYTLSRHTQMFCITHLPVVAAQADHHIQVEKKTGKLSTALAFSYLNFEQKINEIARMLSGHSSHAAALQHAQMLLSKPIR